MSSYTFKSSDEPFGADAKLLGSVLQVIDLIPTRYKYSYEPQIIVPVSDVFSNNTRYNIKFSSN